MAAGEGGNVVGSDGELSSQMSETETDRTEAGDETSAEQPSPPWIPALLVAVAVVLVLVFVFGRRDGSSDDGAKPKDTSTEAAPAGGGDDGGQGSDAPTPTTAPASTWPDEMKWKPMITGDRDQGLDAVPPEVPAGLYIWSDFQGWFVWVVDPGGKAGAKGRISTNSEFGSAELVEGATGEFVRNDTQLEFDFTGVGERATGFRFNQGFFTNTVIIDLDGDDVPVFMGNDATPLSPPFVLEKKVR